MLVVCVCRHVSVICSHTQFEVSVQDPSAVDVLEAGYDLSEVIPHFWLRERVSRLPNVRQGLQGQSNE